ncbi:hypothetical protein [Enterobacter asburiae]|uniref:hypothetical protein n=1 Tax=Enterobacter asburiae TaxID=61645 RepID=UPI003F5639D2
MTIKRRQVFYIHGFDPRGAGYYHRLYCEQSKLQTQVNGLDIHVSKRQRRSSYHHVWQLSSGHTETHYNYLGWDDIIRASWSRGWLAIFYDMFYFMCSYFATGRFIVFARISYKQLIAGFYPIIYFFSGIAISLILAFNAARALPVTLFPIWIYCCLYWGIISIVILLSMQTIRYFDHRLAASWLLRIYVFLAQWSENNKPDLEQRICQFTDDIIHGVKNPDNEEVVIIAHSVGTILVVPVLAKVLTTLTCEEYFTNRRVVLITLGECIPLLSLQPSARDFRASLAQLGSDPRLFWLDYTAPTDGACFPLIDPITSCGLPRSTNAGPLLLSPRFFTLYHAEHYKKLRRAWYAMHFLYLMATDKAGRYDFFSLTAGPLSVCQYVGEPT